MIFDLEPGIFDLVERLHPTVGNKCANNIEIKEHIEWRKKQLYSI